MCTRQGTSYLQLRTLPPIAMISRRYGINDECLTISLDEERLLSPDVGLFKLHADGGNGYVERGAEKGASRLDKHEDNGSLIEPKAARQCLGPP